MKISAKKINIKRTDISDMHIGNYPGTGLETYLNDYWLDVSFFSMVVFGDEFCRIDKKLYFMADIDRLKYEIERFITGYYPDVVAVIFENDPAASFTAQLKGESKLNLSLKAVFRARFELTNGKYKYSKVKFTLTGKGLRIIVVSQKM